MIKQKFYELYTKYENLSPKQKALIDILQGFVIFGISMGILSIVVYFSLFAEFAICMLGYGIISMLGLLYRSRVEYYEFKEKFKKQ